jgi:hypothetical protein
VIGFLATWWMGLFIGLLLGLLALIFPDHKTMTIALKKAIGFVLMITVITGAAGFLYGKFILAGNGVGWWLPNDLFDKSSFITVGSIHNFSYLGGIIGLLVAILYLLFRKIRSKQN